LFLPDNADVESALFDVDDSKSSGDELGSREDVCSRTGSKEDAFSRSGTDDAAERGSDSTRDELSESDADAGAATVPEDLDKEADYGAATEPKGLDSEVDAVPKDLDKETDDGTAVERKGVDKEVEVAALPVPMPRRRRGLASPSVSKADEAKPVKTGKPKKIAPKRPDALPARYSQKGTSRRARLGNVDSLVSLVLHCC